MDKLATMTLMNGAVIELLAEGSEFRITNSQWDDPAPIIADDPEDALRVFAGYAAEQMGAYVNNEDSDYLAELFIPGAIPPE